MKAFTLLFTILSTSIYAQGLKQFDLQKRILSHRDLHDPLDLESSSPKSYPLVENIKVQVKFDSINNNDPNSDNERYLAVALWSNETGILYPSEPLPFHRNFVCNMADCISDNLTFEVTSLWAPKTTASRVYLNKTISVAEGAWKLKTSALYVKMESSFQISGASYGWIGLGTDSGAKQNFRDENPMFSILINENRTDNGSLIFGFDSTVADIDNPLMVVNSDSNWKMQMISLSFGSIVYFNTSKPLPIMFDLVIEGIVLPEEIITSLINQMKIYDLTCDYAKCYSNDLSGLPSLVFGLADGKNFSLSPNNYMQAMDIHADFDIYRTLNFRNNENKYYYEDHVVLGWNILAQFYTLFQQIDGVNRISFYEINSATTATNATSILPTPPPTPSSTESSDLTLVLIITGVIILVILLCVGVAIFMTSKKNLDKIEIATTELSKFEDSSTSVEPQEQSNFL